ncbi:MAG: hypothetical protein K8E66_13565 [Phycisphaerales bacterium]|nr:hypothetical protein [Phycisphaerales bacterium]
MSRTDRGRLSRRRRPGVMPRVVLLTLFAWTGGVCAVEPEAVSDTDTSLPEPVDNSASLEAARDVMRRAEAELLEARVLLRTGREIVGLFVERVEREVTLRVRGEDLTLDLANAVEFEMLGSVLGAFEALREATPDDDTPGRLHLVRWLRDRGAYLTALDEVERILALEPFNNEAIQLRVWLDAQLSLRLNAREDAPRDDTGSVHRRKIYNFPVLTPEEINLIRVYEIDFEKPPKLHITRRTVEEFIDLYGEHELMPKDPEGREALLRRDPLTVLDLMFRVQARPLYGEVNVLEDPKSMSAFRSQIHRTWLVGSNSSCASTSCHGGQEAGRLYLNNHRSNTDATMYTNFLILERFRLPDGSALIDYNEPANSPLLQMALPRDRSIHPHPNVGRAAGRRGWRPLFRDQDDMRFRRAVEWIKSMYRPRPEYPIDFTPPVPRGAQRLGDLPPQGER